MSRPFRAPECVWRRYLGLRSTATAVSLTPGCDIAHRWRADRRTSDCQDLVHREHEHDYDYEHEHAQFEHKPLRLKGLC
jgi:hypothetical protein